MFPRLLLLAALLVGCADPYESAHKADTIEAYETFLKENPDSPHKTEAEQRLSALSFKAAKEANTLEAWDAYVAKFPNAKLYKDAMLARLPLAVAQAELVDSADAWEKIATDYARLDRKSVIKARRRAAIAKDRDKIGIGEVAVAQVNLAGDAKGAMDGWKFTAPVTNKGTQPMTELVLGVAFLDDKGADIGDREWPAVAKRLPQNLPMKAGFDTPIAVGETRTWEFQTGEIPAGWTQKVTLKAARVRWLAEVKEGEPGRTEGEEPAKASPVDPKAVPAQTPKTAPTGKPATP